MECEKTLIKLYEKSVEYNKEAYSILANLTKEETAYLENTYAHDIRRNFDINELRFKIREANDRLYYLDNVIANNMKQANNSHTNEDKHEDEEDACSHIILTDTIDVNIDRSMTIRYCSKCEKTFH